MEEDDDEGGVVDGSDTIEKFMKDLTQMMEGMLDLFRRSQLPEAQRQVCMRLLLRISLKDEIFEPTDIGLVKVSSTFIHNPDSFNDWFLKGLVGDYRRKPSSGSCGNNERFRWTRKRSTGRRARQSRRPRPSTHTSAS